MATLFRKNILPFVGGALVYIGLTETIYIPANSGPMNPGEHWFNLFLTPTYLKVFFIGFTAILLGTGLMIGVRKAYRMAQIYLLLRIVNLLVEPFYLDHVGDITIIDLIWGWWIPNITELFPMMVFSILLFLHNPHTDDKEICPTIRCS